MGSTRGTRHQLYFIILLLALNFTQIAGLTIPSIGPLQGENLVEGNNNASQPINESDDTLRVDPLNHFKKYRGGYDITNKHYWSSTIFTGIYGYAIGVLWLVGGIVYGAFLLTTIYCSKRKQKQKARVISPCYKQCCLWPTLLAIFFTVLAVAASGLILGADAKFNSRARTVVNIVMETANDASETIYNTTGAMKDMITELGTSSESSEQTSNFLFSTSQQLDAEAADIQKQANKNRRLIDKGLKIVYAVTIVTIVLNLIAVIALSVSGVLRLRRTLHLLIILCWFLTVMCWLLFGLYFFLDKFSGDTCTALENFQENPYNNSLSSILPCDELVSAQSVLDNVSAGIYNLVNEVNNNISLMQTTYPNVIYVCNPFSGPPDYQYGPENCPANTIRIGDIPQVLKIFTCSGTDTGSCKVGKFISASDYKTVEAYSSSIQTLLNVYPDMEDLVECQSVKNAFSEILHKHCTPLKKYAHMVWAALVSLSLIMVLLVLLWTDQAHYEQQQHSLDISVKPHFTNEVETATVGIDNSSVSSA